MIKFKNVRFKNFISYGQNTTEIWLDYKPTTVLIGESGAGKSTVTDALCFALFGRPFRPIHKAQLVNSINGKDCSVEIEFDIGSNSYLIKRGIKPSIFEIYCNGVLLNQDSHSKDYQEHLEKNILHFNFRTFSQIVVLSAANFTPFMKLKPQDRRLIIEDLLDIQIFSVMSTILKEKMTNLKNEAVAIAAEISACKDKIDLYTTYVESLKRDKERQIEENDKKIETHVDKINENNEAIDKFQTKIQALEELIQDEIALKKKLTTYETYQRDIESNLRKLRKELKFYEDNKECPTCSREFEAEYKKGIIEEKSKKEKEYEAGLKKLETSLDQLGLRNEEIYKVKTEIDVYRKRIQDKEINVASLVQYVEKLNQENDDLKLNQKNVAEETAKLDELTLKAKEFEKSREKLANDKMIHELATNLLKDSGIKTQIIKQYLPVINKLINRFLTAMNFYVTFNIDENFNEVIKSRGHDVFTYACLSEGERQRLDIAILLTWRTVAMIKNSVKTNLLFIDELLDSSLGPVATENILELISNEPILKNSNIFIISHKTNMIDKFSEYIKFEKKGNFSRVIP